MIKSAREWLLLGKKKAGPLSRERLMEKVKKKGHPNL